MTLAAYLTNDLVNIHSTVGSFFYRKCEADEELKAILSNANLEKCIDNGKDAVFNYLYTRLNYELGGYDSPFHHVLYPTLAWYVLRNAQHRLITGKFEIGEYIDQ